MHEFLILVPVGKRTRHSDLYFSLTILVTFLWIEKTGGKCCGLCCRAVCITRNFFKTQNPRLQTESGLWWRAYGICFVKWKQFQWKLDRAVGRWQNPGLKNFLWHPVPRGENKILKNPWARASPGLGFYHVQVTTTSNQIYLVTFTLMSLLRISIFCPIGST